MKLVSRNPSRKKRFDMIPYVWTTFGVCQDSLVQLFHHVSLNIFNRKERVECSPWPPSLRWSMRLPFINASISAQRLLETTLTHYGITSEGELAAAHATRKARRREREACALLGNADILGNREGSREVFTPGIWLGS